MERFSRFAVGLVGKFWARPEQQAPAHSLVAAPIPKAEPVLKRSGNSEDLKSLERGESASVLNASTGGPTEGKELFAVPQLSNSISDPGLSAPAIASLSALTPEEELSEKADMAPDMAPQAEGEQRDTEVACRMREGGLQGL